MTTSIIGQEEQIQSEIEYYDSLMNNYKFEDYQFDIKCELTKLADSIFWGNLKHLPNEIKNNIKSQFYNDKSNLGSCYKIIIWGCGSSCQMIAIFDKQTGYCMDTLSASYGADYKTDSRLIIINPPLDQKMNIGQRKIFGEPIFYELQKNKITIIKQ